MCKPSSLGFLHHARKSRTALRRLASSRRSNSPIRKQIYCMLRDCRKGHSLASPRRSSSPIREQVYCMLQDCTKTNDLGDCRKAHSLMIESGLESVPVLGDHLIRVLASNGSLSDAHYVFERIAAPSVYSWNAIISAHTSLGYAEKALKLYDMMLQANIAPDTVTFVAMIEACIGAKKLEEGRVIHAQIVVYGLHRDVYTGSCLVDLYSKVGSLKEALKVFNDLSERDVVSWGTMIAGFVHHGCNEGAQSCFQQMQRESIQPNKVIFLLCLKACGNLGTLWKGRVTHYQASMYGFDLDVSLASTLVEMYSKCGSLEEARSVFEQIQLRDLVLWSVMIIGYVQHGLGLPALRLYQEMIEAGTEPDKVTILCCLQACASLKAIGEGMWIHDQIIKEGFESEQFVTNTLLDMYSKCGGFNFAMTLFQAMQNRNAVSWAVMISGSVQQNCSFLTFKLFAQMHEEGIEPNTAVLLCILKACASLDLLPQGRLIHEYIVQNSVDKESNIGNALTHLYAKCGSPHEAHKLFDNLLRRDIVSWSVIIAGLAEQGEGLYALKLCQRIQLEGIKLDSTICLSILKACGTIGAGGFGRLIHYIIVSSGFDSDVALRSALIEMYILCESLGEAQKVADESGYQDVVLCSQLMCGYYERGDHTLALELFGKLQKNGATLDRVSYLCICRICGSIGALQKGRLMHGQIVETQSGLGAEIGSTLVYMYIKCGALEDAHHVFHKLPNHDLVLWSALISAYAEHGDTNMTRECFKDMQREGCKPNHVIFTSILTACSHSGLLHEGLHYFKSMREKYGIIPNIEHYNCILDLLGRVGSLKQAAELLQTMPILPDVIGWTSLLASCKMHGNNDVGKECFNQVV